MLDVIRMASSAIEWYPQVAIGPVAELAVPGYAADDIATLMSALLDNATRYSPGMVTVSCHLLEHGGVMFRIEDTGLGMARDQVARLNLALAGPVPDVNESTARHTGFPVVHRIARKHSIGVRFASRRPPGTGTLAMVTLPPQLLCAIPAQDTPHRPAAAELPAPEADSGNRGSRSAPPRADGPGAAVLGRGDSDAGGAAGGCPAGGRTAGARTAGGCAAGGRIPAGGAARPPVPVSAEISPLVPARRLAGGRVAGGGIGGGGPRRASLRAAPPRTGQPARRRAEASRGRPPPPQPQPQPQQAAARLAFANDLSAFSQGIQQALAARGITGGLVSALFDGPVIKEGAQS